MIKAKLFYRIFKVKDDKPIFFLGTTFPVEPNGGFLTCRHVVDVKLSDGEYLAVFDEEQKRLVRIGEIKFPSDTSLDIAYIPNALQSPKEEYIPFLNPIDLRVGEDVYVFGYFNEHENHITTQDAYFGGKIVNFTYAPNSQHAALSLPFAVIEGMSGSPILTYHNGVKIVGMAIASKSARVVASEAIEYEDERLKYKETVNRIMEFGVGYHGATLIDACGELEITEALVTNDSVDIPNL